LSTPQPEDTRARLLHAAAEVFAEHGYEAATIRQICARAGANVALVNYHFGDKLELYTEVLRTCLPPKGSPAVVLQSVGDDPLAALRQMIAAMVARGFETGDQADLRFRLMLHEFKTPSDATARIVDVVMRPVYDCLLEIVGTILKLPPDDNKTRLCVHSILGQVAHFAHSRHMINLLWPELCSDEAHRERVTEHIFQFSTAYLVSPSKRRAK